MEVEESCSRRSSRNLSITAGPVRVLLAALLASLVLVGCAGRTGDVLSATAAPSASSSYPAPWAAGICTAWEQFELGAPEREYALARRALTALSLTPSWPPGTAARDRLIEYFKLVERREIEGLDPPAAGSGDVVALEAALEQARVALGETERETGETLRCGAGSMPARPAGSPAG